MSIPWGPALEAELAYRQEQVRTDIRRRNSHRKPAKAHPAEVVAQHVPPPHIQASQIQAPHVQAPHIAAQRGPVPLISIRPRPIDQVTVPLESTQPADTKVNQEQPSAHAA